jgi:acetyltransferase-like isoleucine patch superfamily enzyme
MALFYLAAAIRRLFPPAGVELGSNVRLQRNRCVMAEAPDSRIRIGSDSLIYEKATVNAFDGGRIEIGEKSVLGDIIIISRLRITIGKRFLSSWNVYIADYDPHPTDPELRGLQVSAMCENFRPSFAPPKNPVADLWRAKDWKFPVEEISIGDDVWVGANATILKGARIGDGCIIATGAVVLKGDYPARSVLAGNPAKVVKTL